MISFSYSKILRCCGFANSLDIHICGVPTMFLEAGLLLVARRGKGAKQESKCVSLEV